MGRRLVLTVDAHDDQISVDLRGITNDDLIWHSFANNAGRVKWIELMAGDHGCQFMVGPQPPIAVQSAQIVEIRPATHRSRRICDVKDVNVGVGAPCDSLRVSYRCQRTRTEINRNQDSTDLHDAP